MKSFIKTLVYQILGQKLYLKSLFIGYKWAYELGFLKKDFIYKYHYFSKKFIAKGDVVLDIGANLGYYTYLFKKWVGDKGKVIAVEPVKNYQEIILWQNANAKNVQLYPYALGGENKLVQLVVDGNENYLRTGLAHIQEGKSTDTKFSFDAEMKDVSSIFNDLEKINFIKMDIEGYEAVIIPLMKNLLSIHLPIIQIETWGENRKVVHETLASLNYHAFELEDGILKPQNEVKPGTIGDVIYLQQKHKEQFIP